MKKFDSNTIEYLLGVARDAITARSGGKSLDSNEIPESVRQKAGVFVTLREKGELRGCVGLMEPLKPIYEAVAEYAVKAAYEDSRFQPIAPDELDDIDIEISILSRLVDHSFDGSGDSVALLEKERPGVLLSTSTARATFLPQVWEEVSGGEEFLSALCLKAGLPPLLWKQAPEEIRLQTYSVRKIP